MQPAGDPPRITDSSSNKRAQLFIRAHYETLSVVAMRVNNPDRSPVPPSIRAALARRGRRGEGQCSASESARRGTLGVAEGSPHLSRIAAMPRSSWRPAWEITMGQRGERDSRARARAAIVWRSHWLCAYAMSGSKVMACRVARVGHSTADYHLKNDLDFAALAEGAKDIADDLLHTRCLQRCIEGDIEPVVGHIQKFDTHLQIEMLRAHLPSTFKTPGQGGNINIKDSNVLVMTEEMRAKLMAANRERIMALPDSFDMLAARVATLQESQSHESQ